MPELPEVETIVNDLNKNVKGLKITNVWVDPPPFPRTCSGKTNRKGGREGASWKKNYNNFVEQTKK